MPDAQNFKSVRHIYYQQSSRELHEFNEFSRIALPSCLFVVIRVIRGSFGLSSKFIYVENGC